VLTIAVYSALLRSLRSNMPSRKVLREAAAFSRMAAIELRRLATRSPEVAAELVHLAAQLEADARDLEDPSEEEAV
jgi:hypothetical protein